MNKEDIARKIIEIIDAYGENKLGMIIAIEEYCKQIIQESLDENKDLEKEIEMICKHHFINSDFDKVELEGRNIKNIAHHFTDWQKRQIFKDAVHGTIDYPIIGHDFPNIYPNYKELKEYCDNHKIKDDSRVKIALMKV